MTNESAQPEKIKNGISRQNIHEKAIEEHIERIGREFRRGFEFLQKYPKSVTIFGSSMAAPDSAWYRHAESLASEIVSKLGYTIISGGGPGIMEAASRGASDGKGSSVGFRINLLREQTARIHAGEGVDFTYFFTRKALLAFAAEAYVFFPGGYGTFDELFSVLTLIQTNKIPRVPVILFESSFWGPLKEFMMKHMLADTRAIDPQDIDLFEITDDPKRVIEIIAKAPVSEWWRNLN